MLSVIENPYENFIALSRYARWIPEENRRETWGETVDRYFSFMLNHPFPTDSKEELIIFERRITHPDSPVLWPS